MTDPDPRAEIAELAPAPFLETAALPLDRHFQLRRHLMTEISPAVRRAPRRALAMAGALGGVLAVVTAVTVIARVPAPTAPALLPAAAASESRSPLELPRDSGDLPVTRAPEFVTPGTGTLTQAALDQAAQDAIANATDPVIPPDAFVYLKRRAGDTFYDHSSGRPVGVLTAVRDREDWIPQAGGRTGLYIEDGETVTLGNPAGNAVSASLPTDPEALLAQSYRDSAGQHAKKGADFNADGEAFAWIADHLRSSLLPAAVRAALFRAAARIPGATILADSVDAADRHGAAVVRTNGEIRQELIFDLETMEFLGERSYRESDRLLISISAITARAVVNAAGVRP